MYGSIAHNTIWYGPTTCWRTRET